MAHGVARWRNALSSIIFHDMSADLDDLYERDFYAWTRRQAAALRHAGVERINTQEPIDWANLAEEVEDLGNEQRRAIASQLERLIQHLLKLEFAEDRTPRRKWLLSIDNARAEIERRWTASIAREIEPTLPRAHARARRAAALELEDHGEPKTAQALPEGPHYTLEQLLDESWYPTAEER
jgi:hypothetical protein